MDDAAGERRFGEEALEDGARAGGGIGAHRRLRRTNGRSKRRESSSTVQRAVTAWLSRSNGDPFARGPGRFDTRTVASYARRGWFAGSTRRRPTTPPTAGQAARPGPGPTAPATLRRTAPAGRTSLALPIVGLTRRRMAALLGASSRSGSSSSSPARSARRPPRPAGPSEMVAANDASEVGHRRPPARARPDRPAALHRPAGARLRPRRAEEIPFSLARGAAARPPMRPARRRSGSARRSQ